MSLVTTSEKMKKRNTSSFSKEISNMMNKYVKTIRTELLQRYKGWALDFSQMEKYEVIGALMARQVSLASNLANAPSTWNAHLAPIILRTMVDTYINLAWIFEEPIDRARKFILYGLGREKLMLEHYKAHLKSLGEDVEKHQLLVSIEEWINSQRFTFLTEVDVGGWAGIDTRKMAEEANCKDIYDFAFTPFSSCTHSMWNHVCKYNLKNCSNPLHRYHRIPIVPDLAPDFDYLYRAAEYVEKTFKLFDKKTKVKVKISSAFETLNKDLSKLGKKYRKSNK